jgi:hypothetical protein
MRGASPGRPCQKNPRKSQVLPAGRNFGRKTQKWSSVAGRNSSRFFCRFFKKWQKSGRTFLRCVLHRKALIICTNILVNLWVKSTFFATNLRQKCLKNKKKIMCAAEFFRQRPKFSPDLAEIICQELATLKISLELQRLLQTNCHWPGTLSGVLCSAVGVSHTNPGTG